MNRMGIILSYCAVAVILLLGLCSPRMANAVDGETIGLYVVFVDRPVQLSDWESVDELQAFLDDTTIRLVIISGESFNGQCENMAFQLRDLAAEHGKRIETEILTRSECYKYQEHLQIPYEAIWSIKQQDGHYICKAVIGNEVWYIEPVNDNIWLAIKLD